MADPDGQVIAKAVYSEYLSPTWASSGVMYEDVWAYFADAYAAIKRPLQNKEMDILRKITAEDPSEAQFTLDSMARKGFPAISPDPPLESEIEAVVESMARNIQGPSLAHIVDKVVRYLRLNRELPASRWATFVHVGA